MVKSDRGKSIVASHYKAKPDESDAQTAYKELQDYHLRSFKATDRSSTMMAFITTASISDWNGTTEQFIIYWKKQRDDNIPIRGRQSMTTCAYYSCRKRCPPFRSSKRSRQPSNFMRRAALQLRVRLILNDTTISSWKRLWRMTMAPSVRTDPNDTC